MIAKVAEVKCRPVEDRVLLKMHLVDGQTPGGILLPHQREMLDTRGTVIAVGPGKWVNGNLIPISLQVGDVVVIPPYQGPAITVVVDEEEYVVIKECDVLCVLT